MRGDADIQRDVQDEIRKEPLLRLSEIAAIVRDGVVMLVGCADSLAGKHAAREVPCRALEVRSVAGEVRVRLPREDERTDVDIRRAAVTRMARVVPSSEGG